MKYALWLHHAAGLGSARCHSLLERGITAQKLYHMNRRELDALPELGRNLAQAVCRSREAWDLEREFLSLGERGIGFVSIEQDIFPERLRNIPSPPYALYYKGSLPDEGPAAAIVGARSRSEYGRTVARQLGRSLAGRGIAVISGLARGIDADGHKGALDGGGRTFAVLGCGVDICYPRSHQFLYDQILENGGGILSEYHPSQEPLPGLFPHRNRIISGLSDCVAVIEAKKKSGSLITADYALEQGREVYALPGRITDPLSMGCNELIRQGAQVMTSVEDLLPATYIQMDFRKFLLEKDEQLVYSLLDFCPAGIGTLLEKSGMPLDKLLDVLKDLESRQYARECVPNFYVKMV